MLLVLGAIYALGGFSPIWGDGEGEIMVGVDEGWLGKVGTKAW